MQYEELAEKVKEWANERELDSADPRIQWMRVTEEIGEIRDVLLKPTKFANPDVAMQDALGDSLVTLIVLAHQLGFDTVECLALAYQVIKDRKGKMVNGSFVKSEDLDHDQ